MGNRYGERCCGYEVSCGFGGADGVLHTMSGSWGPSVLSFPRAVPSLKRDPLNCYCTTTLYD